MAVSSSIGGPLAQRSSGSGWSGRSHDQAASLVYNEFVRDTVIEPRVHLEPDPAFKGRRRELTNPAGKSLYHHLEQGFSVYRSEAGTSRFRPVISDGCGIPKRNKSVGDTSARIPSLQRNSAASCAT